MYLQNKIDLNQCIKNIQLVTRHYVKRQNTWWRSSKLPILEKINEFPDEIDLKSSEQQMIFTDYAYMIAKALQSKNKGRVQEEIMTLKSSLYLEQMLKS